MAITSNWSRAKHKYPLHHHIEPFGGLWVFNSKSPFNFFLKSLLLSDLFLVNAKIPEKVGL
jgi:hypothetical protein